MAITDILIFLKKYMIITKQYIKNNINNLKTLIWIIIGYLSNITL